MRSFSEEVGLCVTGCDGEVEGCVGEAEGEAQGEAQGEVVEGAGEQLMEAYWLAMVVSKTA